MRFDNLVRIGFVYESWRMLSCCQKDKNANNACEIAREFFSLSQVISILSK